MCRRKVFPEFTLQRQVHGTLVVIHGTLVVIPMASAFLELFKIARFPPVLE
jgi:hypothetical protein